jgi:hypothetical protein
MTLQHRSDAAGSVPRKEAAHALRLSFSAYREKLRGASPVDEQTELLMSYHEVFLVLFVGHCLRQAEVSVKLAEQLSAPLAAAAAKRALEGAHETGDGRRRRATQPLRYVAELSFGLACAYRDVVRRSLWPDRRLHQMRRRAAIERVGNVGVAQVVRRDLARQAGPRRGPLHDPVDLRRIERAALSPRFRGDLRAAWPPGMRNGLEQRK